MPSHVRPTVIHDVGMLREAVKALRAAGKRIGFVPTMGALHEGHMSLVRACRAECGASVVSIYVNPSQFGPSEDFARYPRTLEADLDLLAAEGIDLVFAPENEAVYGPGHATWVDPGGVAELLEGQCRPGHFRGVATVVLKLFGMVRPDVAYFGQKDYQQAQVIRQMVADLDVSVEIRVCPTVREADGLAMSSRNRYLSPEARQRALVLWRSLEAAHAALSAGERSTAAIEGTMHEVLATAPEAEIEYAVVVHPDTLAPIDRVESGAVALLAVRIEGTRLIDNRILQAD
ncbi:MAG: pantoate--beta-alanine ligase [Planctomycetota bacterium]